MAEGVKGVVGTVDEEGGGDEGEEVRRGEGVGEVVRWVMRVGVHARVSQAKQRGVRGGKV